MSNRYNTLVFIGRFQPFHLGHQAVVDQALQQADQVVIVVGSSFAARDVRNPFTFDERQRMIRSVYPNVDRVKIVAVRDFPYDENKWVAAVQNAVLSTNTNTARIGLIGHSKDHTSYYLNMFPKWDSEDVDNYMGINATDIRRHIFHEIKYGNRCFDIKALSMSVDCIAKSIVNETARQEFNVLFNEHEMITAYKKSWEVAPHPPIFVTTDAVIIQSGHILLIKRKAAPGAGLWALPGGFLETYERIVDGMIRELRQETKLKVPVPVLKGSIKETRVFDAPNRSARGRTITHAFFIDLGMGELPKVTAADDAKKAVWVPFSNVDSSKMFEDHYSIIDYFVSIG